jgi:tetratricopeptide (TPR) repeat protein
MMRFSDITDIVINQSDMKLKIGRIFSWIKKLPISWNWVKTVGDGVFQAGWRLGVLLLLIGVTFFLIKGLQNETYAIETFQVPEIFEQSGYTGVVLAKKLVDELNEVENFISSSKEGPLNNIQSNVGEPDLNVEVMGIGLTLNTVTYYLRDLLGRQNRSISGEITDIDQSLSLTLRITGAAPFHASYSYSESDRAVGIKYLLHEASKQIILHLDPYRIAVYHYKKNDEKKSLEVIGEILKTRPEDAGWAYMAWGNLLNQLGEQEEAIEKFKLASERDPDLDLVRNNWAWTEFRLENYETAIALFKKLTKVNPKRGDYWNAIARCYQGLDQPEQVNKAYANAVNAEPDQIYWYGNWAEYRQLQGDTAGVQEIFRIMEEKSALSEANYHLAQAYLSFFKGKNEEALFNMERALALEPFNLDVLRQYVPLCFNIKKDYPKVKRLSYRLIEQANEQNHMPPRFFRQTFYNYMAMAEYSMEEFDSALVHAQMAIDQDTSSAFPYSTLAETYELMGDLEAFYENTEIALSKGFKVEDYLNQEPYIRYKEEKKFQYLLEKYKP